MNDRRPALDPMIDRIASDEFKCGLDYSNWRPKGSRSYLLILTLAGAGRYVTKGGEYVSSPGDVTLYEPGEEQDYRTAASIGRWHLLWSHFIPRPHWMEWLNWPKVGSGLRRIHLDGERFNLTASALKRCVRHGRGNAPLNHEWSMHAMEEVLLWSQLSLDNRQGMQRDDRIRNIIDWISGNLKQNLSLAQMARRSGLSISRLSHLFKEQTGETPQQFRENVKMEQASRLLRLTDQTVAQVSEEVGYDNPFYFSNRFRHVTGLSPRAFRKKERGQ